ncbi:MAG: DUF58 domain-containing protein [Anaerolineales bacterium]|nr:DUF58 domain-containing protein [Anaerolineales bacterium]
MARMSRWVRLGIFVLILGFILNRMGFLAMAGMTFAVFGVAWLWNRYSLQGVQYLRHLHFRRSFPGESVDCNIVVENRKLLPLGWLVTSDRWAKAVAPHDEELLTASQNPEEGTLDFVMAMRPFHRIQRSFSLLFRKRGVYSLGPVTARSGDPFGIMESREKIAEDQRVVVYPELIPVEEIGLRPEDPFGLSRSHRKIYEDESRPMGIRDYRPEDGFRRIHWPATARVGELQTRVFQPISGLDLIICLNVATFDPYWLGIQPILLERLISTAGSLAVQAFNDGYRVGLISNGGVAHAGKAFRIPPGRSPKQLPALLEALAGMTPVVSGPFDRFLLKQAPNLEYGSVLLVISALTPPSLLETLVRLRTRSRKILLVSLGEEIIPETPGIEVISYPARDEEPVH